MNYKSFREMLKKVFLALFVVAAIACNASPRVVLENKPGQLAPDTEQGIIVQEVVNLFETVHYKKVPFNDSLSAVIFDNYMETLDEGKNYLLQSDVDEFKQYRNTLLSDLKEGDLSVMFHMFNVYQARYLERLNYAVSQIKTKFDFTKDESYTYDRKNEKWFASSKEANQTWRKRVKYDLLTLKLSQTNPDSISKSIKTLTERYNNLISMTKKTNSKDAFQIMMNAFTGSIDPHTNYFNPSYAQAFNEDMAKSFEGIGARLMLENEVVKVIEIIPGGPAYKDKSLQVNDRIIAVAQGDDEFVDVVGWRLDNTVTKIKGPKGTTVRLKIIPAGQELTAKPKIITLVRDKVNMEDTATKTVKTLKGDDGNTYKIGVITIPSFYMDFKAYNANDTNYKSTTRDVKLILDTLKQEKVDAVVIDLRNNGGGSLMEAISLTGLFIDQGPVVQVRDTRNRIDVNSDEDPGIYWDGPLGIMINRFSASASEILAAAIQDYGRGLIIGTQSYGKGTVQSAIDMARVISPTNRLLLKAKAKADKSFVPQGAPEFGQINLTMAKFYRITGSSTQHKGVMPDIIFPMMFPADKFGESSEPSALHWDQIEATDFNVVADLAPLIDTLEKKHEKRMQASPEYQYLLDDIQHLKERENETAVTLQESKLKKEREEKENRSLERTNARRKLQGLEPIKKGESSPKEAVYDFIEDESLNVMVDMLLLTAQ